MPTRICVAYRIIIDIRIPIIPLHPGRDNRVRLGETSQGGVVPAGVVIHQAEIRGVTVLTCVGVVRGIRTGIVVHFTLAKHPVGKLCTWSGGPQVRWRW